MVPAKLEGTLNIKTVHTASGIHKRAIQGRAFPSLLCVWSMMYPIARSDKPSKIFEIAIIEAAAAALAPTTLV